MRKHFEKDWKIYAQCKDCWCYFEATTENFTRDKTCWMWLCVRCKSCLAKRYMEVRKPYADEYRKRTKEWTAIRWKMYRDKHREQINEYKRKRYQKNKIKINLLNKAKWYSSIHVRTAKKIKELWIRPNVCSICWLEWHKIVAHHPDYTKRNEVVFLCCMCHELIHEWRLECNIKPIDILTFKL